MAYAKSSATDLDDLFSKLTTFLVANGWTLDRAHNVAAPYAKMPSWHKRSCYVSFRYDNYNVQAQGISVGGPYQATGFSATQKSGNHPGDSGAGYYTSGTTFYDSSADSQRCLYALGSGPFNYWFFERDDGGSGVFYVHVVLENRQGECRHFGFGLLDKFGDWGAGASGGEYAYGWRNESGYEGSDSAFGLDGAVTQTSQEGVDSTASMRVVGLPGAYSGGWGSFVSSSALATQSKDRANGQRAQLQGGGRGGPFPRAIGLFGGYPGFTAAIPMTPIHAWLLDYTVTPKEVRLLGHQADVRALSIANFVLGEEVTIGSDTWVMFPTLRKGVVGGSTPQSDSRYQGWAYRKDTT